MVRALRYRNYRLFFSGQIVSLTGTWMTNIAMSWLVYRLTGSAILLGAISFASQFPTFICAPVAGIFVDRWDRHKLLVATQTLSMLQSFALAFFTFSHRMTIPILATLAAAQGIINGFDMPARQTFVVEMVEKREDLGNAIALNSSMVNAARLLGPSIGGIIIAAAGEGWCFFIDGVSYVAVIAALLAMTLKASRKTPGRKQSAFTELRAGCAYAFGFSPIRSTILLLALVSLLGVPYAVLMPVFAGAILHGGAHTLGFLMAASGCGALIGAAWLASRKTAQGLEKAIPRAAMIFGLGLLAFSQSRTLWLSLLLVVVAGFGFMVQMAASNTLLQTIVDDNLRGRVMSFFAMSFMGAAPLGSLLAGTLADKIGAPGALTLGGCGCLLGALWFQRALPSIERDIRLAEPAPAAA